MRAARVRSVCDECIELPGREPLEDANSLGHRDIHEMSSEAAAKLLPQTARGGARVFMSTEGFGRGGVKW
jgi:hypothetical protein